MNVAFYCSSDKKLIRNGTHSKSYPGLCPNLNEYCLWYACKSYLEVIFVPINTNIKINHTSSKLLDAKKLEDSHLISCRPAQILNAIFMLFFITVVAILSALKLKLNSIWLTYFHSLLCCTELILALFFG